MPEYFFQGRRLPESPFENLVTQFGTCDNCGSQGQRLYRSPVRDDVCLCTRCAKRTLRDAREQAEVRG